MNPPSTPTSTRQCRALVDAVNHSLERHPHVALVDVRYANGGDPAVVSALDGAGLLGKLASYGGWNTASNSLGTTLAAGVSAVMSPETDGVRERFLARKIIEDSHYLPVVRKRIQDDIATRGLLDFPLSELQEVEQPITRDLDDWARGLRSLPGWRVKNATLPWTYAFSVDFKPSRETAPH